jgi:hypothetical protein
MGHLTLLGAGKPPVAVAGLSYVYKTLDTGFIGGGTVQTFSADVGTAAADRTIILGFQCQTGNSIVSATVNGQALTSRIADNTNEFVAIYDGTGTAFGSGSQSVVITWGTGSFLDRTCWVWVATGLATGFISADANGNTSASVTVNSGDFVFGTSVAQAANSWSPTPDGFHTDSNRGSAADWVASSGGAFNVSQTGASNVVIANYR